VRINDDNLDLANELRKLIHDRTDYIEDGEGVAMILLWSFFLDSGVVNNMDPVEVARNKFAAFLEYAPTTLKHEHQPPKHKEH
jgi:hypothetical protein